MNTKSKHYIYLPVIFLITAASCLKSKDDPPAPPTPPPVVVSYDWTKIADSAQASLSYFYNAGGKFYLSSNVSSDWTQYWPTAHTLDVLVDGLLRSGLPAYKNKMDDLLTGMKAKNGNTWINHFYDDMEWMALASLRALQATGDTRYKEVIDVIWPDIRNGWSAELGGGIWWNKDRDSKNACSNGPAAIFAARMYKQFGNAADLDLAKNIYAWEKAKLFNAASGGVYDNIDKNGAVQTSPGWIFTYNQGTFLGAAYELYKITGETAYLNDAISASDFAVNTLLTNGLLKNEGGGDGGLFKGVFVRYLTRLVIDGNLPSDKKTTYITFLKKNAESLWSKGTNKQFPLFGSAWDASPGTSTDLSTQLSGIMLFESLAELKKAGLL